MQIQSILSGFRTNSTGEVKSLHGGRFQLQGIVFSICVSVCSTLCEYIVYGERNSILPFGFI